MFKVGDEIVNTKSGERFVVVKAKGEKVNVIGTGGRVGFLYKTVNYEATGRKCPAIHEVLNLLN